MAWPLISSDFLSLLLIITNYKSWEILLAQAGYWVVSQVTKIHNRNSYYRMYRDCLLLSCWEIQREPLRSLFLLTAWACWFVLCIPLGTGLRCQRVERRRGLIKWVFTGQWTVLTTRGVRLIKTIDLFLLNIPPHLSLVGRIVKCYYLHPIRRDTAPRGPPAVLLITLKIGGNARSESER